MVTDSDCCEMVIVTFHEKVISTNKQMFLWNIDDHLSHYVLDGLTYYKWLKLIILTIKMVLFS